MGVEDPHAAHRRADQVWTADGTGPLDSHSAEVVACGALGAARPDVALCDTEEDAPAAGVAEWQTRWIQNPVAARP